MLKNPGTGYMSRYTQSLFTNTHNENLHVPVDRIRILVKDLPEFKPYTRTHPHIERELEMEEYLAGIGFSKADIGDYLDVTRQNINIDETFGAPNLPIEWSDYDIPE